MTNDTDKAIRTIEIARILTQGIGTAELEAANNDISDLADAILDDAEEALADDLDISPALYDEITSLIESDRKGLHIAISLDLASIDD